jgi:hypothetical protein
MMQDPIVEEIHRIRNEYAEKLGYDLHKICEDIRRRQIGTGRKSITRNSRKPIVQPKAA